jgi:hypothetical protein
VVRGRVIPDVVVILVTHIFVFALLVTIHDVGSRIFRAYLCVAQRPGKQSQETWGKGFWWSPVIPGPGKESASRGAWGPGLWGVPSGNQSQEAWGPGGMGFSWAPGKESPWGPGAAARSWVMRQILYINFCT